MEGEEYLSIVDEFMEAVFTRWPKAIVQFGDFQLKWAFETLQCYHNKFCMFNDDIQELIIWEFSFHQLNANLLWPGTFAFVEWLVEHRSWIEGIRCIRLGRVLSSKMIRKLKTT